MLKYKNPLKKLSIGGKNYTSKFQKSDTFETPLKINGQLNVKLKKGFTLIYVFSWSKKNSTKSLASSKDTVIIKKDDHFYIKYMDDKTKAEGFVEIVGK